MKAILIVISIVGVFLCFRAYVRKRQRRNLEKLGEQLAELQMKRAVYEAALSLITSPPPSCPREEIPDWVDLEDFPDWVDPEERKEWIDPEDLKDLYVE